MRRLPDTVEPLYGNLYTAMNRELLRESHRLLRITLERKETVQDQMDAADRLDVGPRYSVYRPAE